MASSCSFGNARNVQLQTPEEIMVMVKPKVDRFIDLVLHEDALVSAFHGFIQVTTDDMRQSHEDYKEGLKLMFASFSKEEWVPGMTYLVHRISEIYMPKLQVLICLLNHSVGKNYVSSKLVCETLLKCENLNLLTHNYFWNYSFALINEIIPNIDYKGVRDLLKLVLEKACGINSSNNICVLASLRAMEMVFSTILSRENSLLPSYLVLDEYQKKAPQDLKERKRYPHWFYSGMLFAFVDTFLPAAQMCSISLFREIRGEEPRYKLVPIVGTSSTMGNVWKLDPNTLKAPMKGLLPYSPELLKPQKGLLKYVLKQPYSRELVCNMLGFTKQTKTRCPMLEKQLVALLVSAMENSETENSEMEEGGPTQLSWQHLSSQLIYFILFQYVSFPHLIEHLRAKLHKKDLRKARDHLMWVLLQFISGSIQKNHLNDFLPFMKLHDWLYPEKEPLPVPDITKTSCTHAFAPVCIWIHLIKKAHVDKAPLKRKLPNCLSLHLEYLQDHANDTDLARHFNTDYRVSLLCNAYSTNQEYFTKPMGVLVEALYGTPKQPATSSGPTVPLSMTLLDSITVHTKMSLIHNIVSHVLGLAQNVSKCSTDANVQPKLSQSNHGLSPALVETYSRLLVYSEIESLGIKSFITHLLPVVFRSHAWGILHTLLEMFSYRLHHFQPNYRVQLLNHLHSLAAVTQTNQTQLHLCVESTALKLITGMSNSDVQPQLSRLPIEPKTLLSNDSEELNKVLVLTIARAIQITGSESLSGTWCKDILSTIMQHTPHSWSSYTLQCFPKTIQDFFASHSTPTESKAQLKRSVEEEYRKWKTMSNENDIILHFSHQGSSSLFLCLLWKMLLDQDRISTIAYEILDRIGARALSAHLRTFADFLVFEFSMTALGQHVSKYVDALNDLIWKCHVIQIDRLILCLALRTFEGNEAQVSFLIIHMLVIKSNEFKNRALDFVKNNSPEHWKQSDWHEKHLVFHRVYEEKFYFEGLRDLNTKKNSNHTYLPVYFGNVCLRFLPVMDIVIHRFIECPPVNMKDKLLEELGCLYKFHDSPLTYLYNTLHYYEQKLCDCPLLKKKLVSIIIGSLKDIRPEGWALSEGYLKYIQDTSEEATWVPDSDYYCKLIGRLVDTLSGKSPFPHTDWRFNEFPNEGAHALHVTCIELMALPVSTKTVGNAVIDVVLKSNTTQIYSTMVAHMNAVGLVLTSLPEPFMTVFYDRIVETIQSPLVTHPLDTMDPFDMYNFAETFNIKSELCCSYVVGLTHSVWQHASLGQICYLPTLLKERFKPVVKTEEQFLFVCHIVCPFLQRFCMDKTRYAMEVTVELYEMLEAVDKNCEKWENIDSICDLLYHIKYQFIGDAIKNEIEKSIRNLRPSIQKKLRFITHLNVEELSIA